MQDYQVNLSHALCIKELHKCLFSIRQGQKVPGRTSSSCKGFANNSMLECNGFLQTLEVHEKKGREGGIGGNH